MPEITQITQIKTKIIYHKKIVSRYFKLIIYAPYIAKAAEPGQFVNIKVSDNSEPLLRRPFSIHRVKDSSIEILYEVVGPGTEILSQRKASEFLDVIGPLGNGFNLNEQTNKRTNEQTLLIAGGMGVAPLVFLAEKLVNRKPMVLIGAKTKSEILCAEEFKRLGCHVKISTDDGSKGCKGKATDLLKNFLRTTHDAQRTTIYACGPKPMLKEITFISQRHNITAQISLEEHLACGIGACLGCVVKTKQGFKRVCKEGPVFNAQELIW